MTFKKKKPQTLSIPDKWVAKAKELDDFFLQEQNLIKQMKKLYDHSNVGKA